MIFNRFFNRNFIFFARSVKNFNTSILSLQNIHYICTNQNIEHVMPKTKSSDVRIKVIDQCLCDHKRKYSTKMIFDRCNEELEKRDFYPITAMNSVRDDMEQIQRIYPGAEIESYRLNRNIIYQQELITIRHNSAIAKNIRAALVCNKLSAVICEQFDRLFTQMVKMLMCYKNVIGIPASFQSIIPPSRLMTL